MYQCRRCGEEIGRVGDGEARHNRLDVAGGVNAQGLEDGLLTGNLTDIALGNPDVLSDEQAPWPARDFEREAKREDDLRTFRVALHGLTARQKQVLDAVDRFATHERAAAFLGVATSTINNTILQIARKLNKKTR